VSGKESITDDEISSRIAPTRGFVEKIGSDVVSERVVPASTTMH
jgi:hypothetical protein